MCKEKLSKSLESLSINNWFFKKLTKNVPVFKTKQTLLLKTHDQTQVLLGRTFHRTLHWGTAGETSRDGSRGQEASESVRCAARPIPPLPPLCKWWWRPGLGDDGSSGGRHSSSDISSVMKELGRESVGSGGGREATSPSIPTSLRLSLCRRRVAQRTSTIRAITAITAPTEATMTII